MGRTTTVGVYAGSCSTNGTVILNGAVVGVGRHK